MEMDKKYWRLAHQALKARDTVRAHRLEIGESFTFLVDLLDVYERYCEMTARKFSFEGEFSALPPEGE